MQLTQSFQRWCREAPFKNSLVITNLPSAITAQHFQMMDYYNLLEVERNASSSDIKKAYRYPIVLSSHGHLLDFSSVHKLFAIR